MSKKIFITGSSGFVGKKLVTFLEGAEFQVFGYSERLENFERLSSDLESFGPDIVIHLAALSHVQYCELHPSEAYISNVSGTSILLEAMGRLKSKPNLIFASSAQVYNFKSSRISEGPIDEIFELGPNNVYGRTKLDAEMIIRGTTAVKGLRAVVLRLFNHTHRDQDLSFFLPSMYDQILRATDGGTIKVGNLSVRRDFSLVLDLLNVVKAVIDHFSDFEAFEVFNVCSGQAKDLQALVLAMAEAIGKRVEFEVDPQRIRSGEPSSIVGSSKKLSQKTGYTHPERSTADYVHLFLQ